MASSGRLSANAKEKEAIEPKKSARLAEKRKLREELGPLVDEDFYFTPLTRATRTRQSSISPVTVRKDGANSTDANQVDGRATEKLKEMERWVAQARPPRPSTSDPFPLAPSSSNDMEVTVTTESQPSSTTSKGHGGTEAIIVQHSGESEKIPTYVVDDDDDDDVESLYAVEIDVGEKESVASSSSGNPTSSETSKPIKKTFYVNRQDLITLSFPHGMEYPFKVPSFPPPIRQVEICHVAGCPNRKIYSSSTTGAGLCSMECYKQNLEQFNQSHETRDS